MVRSSIWLAVTAVLGVSLLLSAPAHACKCMFPPLETARDDASAVFEGRVLAVEAAPGSDATNGQQLVTLSVVRTWKSLEHDEHISVFTNGSSAACGFVFTKDASYLIYANEDDHKLHVSACSRTKRLSDAAEDLAFLGAGSTPVHVEAKAITRDNARDGKDAGTGNLPPPVPATATPAAASVKKKGCSIGQAADADRSQALLFALPALALWLRRRRVGA